MTITVTVSVSTNQGNGNIRGVIVPHGNNPTVAQIKAGQQANGSSALGSTSKNVTVAGTQIMPAMAGIPEVTSCDAVLVHTNASGLDSNVITFPFTTIGSGAGAATAIAMSGPTTGAQDVESAVYTVTQNGAGLNDFTPSSSVAGDIKTPPVLHLNGTAPQTFTITPISAGVRTIGGTNVNGLTGPTPITLTAAAAAVPILSGVTYTPGVSPNVAVAGNTDVACKLQCEFIQAWHAGQVWDTPTGIASDYVMPTVYDGRSFERMQPGTAGATQPAAFIGAANGLLIDDNGVTDAWKCHYTAGLPIYAWSQTEPTAGTVHSLTLDASDDMKAGYLYHARSRPVTPNGAWTGDATFTVASAADPSLEAETNAILAAMTVQPDATRKGVINNLVIALKACGAWAKIDYLYITAAHTQQAARINWKAGVEALYDGVAPAFTVDRGFALNGTTEELFSAPEVDLLTQFTLNSAHFGVWMETAAASGEHLIGDRFFHAGGRFMRNDGGAIAMKINSAVSEQGFATAPTTGHFMANRASSANEDIYRDGASVGVIAEPSGGTLPHDYIALGRVNGGFGTGRVAAYHVGANLSAEAPALYAALHVYMGAVGASAPPPPAGTTVLLVGNDHVAAGSQVFTDQSSFGRVCTPDASTSWEAAAVGGSATSVGFIHGGALLLCATGPEMALGTGDFTIECWYHQNNAANGFLCNLGSLTLYALGGQENVRLYAPGGDIGGSGSGLAIETDLGSTPISTDHHVALVRHSGVDTIFIDGVPNGNTFPDTNNYAASAMSWGNTPTDDGAINAYMVGMKVRKGQALYTTSFTPPSVPLPA
jgi:hypothetical protein